MSEAKQKYQIKKRCGGEVIYEDEAASFRAVNLYGRLRSDRPRPEA